LGRRRFEWWNQAEAHFEQALAVERRMGASPFEAVMHRYFARVRVS